MPSKLKLYGVPKSPPVRAVHMTLEALKLDYEFKTIDLAAGELQSPEYLKKNPQHTVPTLEEKDGTCIWDSHAIMAYLVRKYGKSDELYPKDFYQRAIVDQRLYYDDGVLFMTLCKKITLLMYGRLKKEELPELVNRIVEAYGLLEIFIGDNQYVAGKSLTIADFSIVTSVSALVLVHPIESAKFPKLTAWLERMKMLPYYDMVNTEGHNELRQAIQKQLAK